MWAMPNRDGSLNIGLYMKLEGPNSFEYFKDKYDEFETYIHRIFPETKWHMPNLR